MPIAELNERDQANRQMMIFRRPDAAHHPYRLSDAVHSHLVEGGEREAYIEIARERPTVSRCMWMIF